LIGIGIAAGQGIERAIVPSPSKKLRWIWMSGAASTSLPDVPGASWQIRKLLARNRITESIVYGDIDENGECFVKE
jgi:hypothetical protein